MVDKHPNTKERRTWLKKPLDDKDICVYLVESPFTFGHSQLIFTTKETVPEEDMFDMSSSVIKESIRILKGKLPEAVQKPIWKTLRDFTKTSGRLIKILLLKVSADEAERQYKVHIVPYFESHLCLTTMLFQKRRDVDKNKTGGMIYWLGKQEKRLDDQIEIWRGTCHFPTALVESFELIKLAEYLKGEKELGRRMKRKGKK